MADLPRLPGASARRTKADIERDIVATRVQLGDTVAALAARLDVKTRMRAKAAAAVAEVRATAQQRPFALATIGATTVLALVVLIRKARS